MQILRNKTIAFFMTVVMLAALVPLRAYGEVKPVTDIEDKLNGISEEEKAVLEELFTIQQEIIAIKGEAADINSEIDFLRPKLQNLELQIKHKQKEYDYQLTVLKQVMVNYQRRGPASYLEILLKADNLSEFLKSINIMKDISHNVKGLLTTIKDRKQELEDQKAVLADNTKLLEVKKHELSDKLHTEQLLQKEQEDYLASLKEDRENYQGQLDNITQMWNDCTSVFTNIITEINRIVEEGYITENELNLDYGFFTIQGYLGEGNFNKVLFEHSNYTKTIFGFKEEQVIIEVPEKQLKLYGYFELAGDSSIQYIVEKGTFYNMPLEKASIEELFRNGPLLINFKNITDLDFKITDVWSQEGTLDFIIIPQF